MARKTEYVTVPPEYERDAGKVFLITEMPASQAERWATRALLAVTRAGIDIPEEAAGTGMAGIALAGVTAMVRSIGGLRWEDAEPLLDEMFTCVQCVPNPSNPTVVRRLIEDDIEEVRTRLFLRERVLSLHVGFSIAGQLSNSPPSSTEPLAGTSTTTSTSPATLAA